MSTHINLAQALHEAPRRLMSSPDYRESNSMTSCLLWEADGAKALRRWEKWSRCFQPRKFRVLPGGGWVPGHSGAVQSMRLESGAHALVIGARAHLYEGRGVRAVAHGMRTAAAAGLSGPIDHLHVLAEGRAAESKLALTLKRLVDALSLQG